MHLSASRGSDVWNNGRGKTHADVGDDVLCLGSSRKLVDVLNCLAYQRKNSKEGRKELSGRRECGSSFVRDYPKQTEEDSRTSLSWFSFRAAM